MEILETNEKQVKCKHTKWDILTYKCKRCGITKEAWERIADTRMVNVMRRGKK